MNTQNPIEDGTMLNILHRQKVQPAFTKADYSPMDWKILTALSDDKVPSFYWAGRRTMREMYHDGNVVGFRIG